MAAFASDRRAGWVRFLVVLLCALFIFGTVAAPAARAEALTVGLFTAAAVLSAATAALGFKLSNSAEGQATLAKMVQDFKVSSTAIGLVLVGSKLNGLIDGVDYIKMQVKAGKTYLDERVVAWVLQYLAKQGVYNDSVFLPASPIGKDYYSDSVNLVNPLDISYMADIIKSYSGWSAIDYRGKIAYLASSSTRLIELYVLQYAYDISSVRITAYSDYCIWRISLKNFDYTFYAAYKWYRDGDSWVINDRGTPAYVAMLRDVSFHFVDNYFPLNIGTLTDGNITGLSSDDTIGKDVVDKSLDEVLAGLKAWAPDWWDSGADSSTNGAAAGTKDLPLNMGSDVKTVTGNPALEVDQPLIYTPWFDQTLDNLRNGETAGTVTNTATSAAETADKAEAAEGTVEDAQVVVQSIISWGLDYISPDKGLFSRFPLCIPYDAYLLVTAALGVDAQDLGDIVGQSPGQLSAQVDDGVAVQSDFIPVISVKHDWTQDGVTTPVEVTIDLRPYDAIIKMIRTLVSVYVIAELIASEYKRIRGS